MCLFSMYDSGMQSDTPNTQGGAGDLQMTVVYASADSPDLQEIDTRRQVTIANTVSNIALYHISDTIDKQQQSKTWRRKVREIIQNHQEQILQFFTKPMPNQHPLHTARVLLTKYGKVYPSLHFDTSRTTPTFLKDYILDISSNGLDSLNEYIDHLTVSRIKETPVTRWVNVTRHLLDYMRDVGDELIRIDSKLKDECLHLDSVIEKVTSIVNLPNPDIDGFETMMEEYIDKQFVKHPIHAVYWDYVYTLQKYSALRDILIPQRLINISEPICCICMTEAIVMAMVPCGHTFCTNCSRRTIVCHVCRQAVTSRLRIFFG
jgi:hypothetical protein